METLILALLATPLVFSLVMAFLPKNTSYHVFAGLNLVSVAAVLVLSIMTAGDVLMSGATASALGLWFHLDSLGAIFVLLIGFIGFLTGLFSLPYVKADIEEGSMPAERAKQYFALFSLFVFTMLPLPSSMDIRGWSETNPLNGPAWSLQWEYIANIMYALFIRRFPKKVLAVCVVAFGALTVMLCMNVDAFGVLKVREYAAYTVIGGWSTTPDQLLIGITRLLYPFFCGLLLSRVGRFIKVRGAFWWCSLLIVVMLAMPSFGVGETRWLNGVYEALCIIVLFPLVVAMGAGSGVGGSKSSAINNFLGNISYPLYITHFPLVYMQMGWVHNHEDAPLGMHIFVSVSVYVLAVISAYAAYRLYDLPVRSWLKSKLFKAAS